MRSWMLLIAVSFLSLSVTCSDTEESHKIKNRDLRQMSAAETQIINTDNTFGFELFSKINKADSSVNIFISPLSVSLALGMALNGAAGETLAEMQQMIKMNDLTLDEINQASLSLITFLMELDSKVIFEIANSIWYQEGFSIKPDFLSVNQTWYQAEVHSLNFNLSSAKDIINQWVANKTHDKIDTIIDEIDPMVIMFLINAIYFKGEWSYQFNHEQTYNGNFQSASNGNTPCRMMIQKNLFDYYKNDQFQAIDLPYGDSLFRMTVVLPTDGENLADLINELDGLTWQSMLDRMEPDSGTLYLPKFKLEYEIQLNDILQALGMQAAFNPITANFSNITDEKIFISEVKHKTFIEVDEEGAEAAAVTSISFEVTSMPPQEQFTMVVNRPFLFVIHESHTQSILFIGKIGDVKTE